MSRDATATEQAQLDLAARAVISYLEGEAVDLHNIERFGQHHDVIFKLSVVYIAYIDPRKPDLGRAQARQRVAEAWQILRPQHPLLAAAVEALLAPPIVEEPGYLPLPEGAGVDDARAAEASPWLDDYIAWSRRWAPRAFEDFHEACGLFDLATTAARRVRIEFGHGVYPSLYLGLAGRTTMWTKTTAADLAVGLLKQAGLGALLAPDDATPQAFISELAGHVPEHYEALSAEAKAVVQLRLGFAAQRGWFYDEFSQQLEAMMRREGPMATFRSLLRRLDDHPDDYHSATIARGTEHLIKPSLTLLANVTPADLQPFAGSHSPLWRDGYLARFAFITPPEHGYRDDAFPSERLIYPPGLLKPLQEWHRALGVPQVTISATGKDGTRRYVADRPPLPETRYTLVEAVRQAYYRYDQALRQLASEADNQDLDGSYGRFAMKALRIAGLLAALHDNGLHRIELCHWHRGQQIAERWRASLHRLVAQLHDKAVHSRASTVEAHIVRTLKKHGLMTKRDLQRRTGIAAIELLKGLEALQNVGLVEALMTAQTTKFRYRYESGNGDDPLGDQS